MTTKRLPLCYEVRKRVVRGSEGPYVYLELRLFDDLELGHWSSSEPVLILEWMSRDKNPDTPDWYTGPTAKVEGARSFLFVQRAAAVARRISFDQRSTPHEVLDTLERKRAIEVKYDPRIHRYARLSEFVDPCLDWYMDNPRNLVKPYGEYYTIGVFARSYDQAIANIKQESWQRRGEPAIAAFRDVWFEANCPVKSNSVDYARPDVTPARELAGPLPQADVL